MGRLSTKVRSILSLEPPSEAKPACISTAMASTTCLSLPTGVSQASSSSLNTFTTFLHFLLLLTLRLTTTAATAHAATATLTATPTATLPMSSPPPTRSTKPKKILHRTLSLHHSPPIIAHHDKTSPFQHAPRMILYPQPNTS